MIDKDLFLHDLAVVAILKNEGPYLKEWLDYHLLAGVDHFYLYDNESSDNQAEVAKPYVEAGLVDYFPFPGKRMQIVAYNDAVKKFKFQCRYMAFIDADEFIFPRLTETGVIINVVDEILSQVADNPKANGLAINWQCFGSNGEEKADYSRGVLERFTRRAPRNWVDSVKTGKKRYVQSNQHVKIIANPRKINFINDMHKMNYFDAGYSVTSNLEPAWGGCSIPICFDKIVINHYQLKSREEYLTRRTRGIAFAGPDVALKFYDDERFLISDRNDEFDDGILKYRDARAKIYKTPDDSHADERLFKALSENLLPTFLPNTSSEFYANKMETFLTCRAVASYLKTKLADNELAKFYEEASLKAILKSLDKMSVADAQLLMRELPNILSLPYPVIKEISVEIIQRITQIMKGLNIEIAWDCFINLLIRELPNILSLPYPVIKEIFDGIIQRTQQIMKYLFFNGAWDCFIKFHHLQELLYEISDSKQLIAVRIDIKLMTTTGDFQILYVSDNKAAVWKPGWMQKDCVGYQIQSYWNASELEIVAKSEVDGQINLELKGLDTFTSEDRSERFPYWVDYTKFTVNGSLIFDTLTPACYDKPYCYKFDVKVGEEIKIRVEWQPHRSDT